MEDEKSKVVKLISKMIISFSVFIIVSNVMGIFVYFLIRPGSEPNEQILNLKIWNYFVGICLIMIVLSSINLLSGIYLLKFKNWSRIIVILTSIMFICVIGVISIIINVSISVHLIKTGPAIFMAAVIFSIPFIISIYNLARKDIRTLFT